MVSPRPNILRGEKCGDYVSHFFDNDGLGYIGNHNITDFCDYCQYSNGNNYHEERIGQSFSNRWSSLGLHYR